MSFLDLVFPKTCVGCSAWGSYLCEICQKKIVFLERQFCPECGRSAINGVTHPICQKTFGLNGLISLTYLHFPINKLIHKLKYGFTTDLASEIVERISLPKDSLNFPAQLVLVPIPLHWQRKNYRGFNQAEILGNLYAQKVGFAFEKSWLLRAQNTQPQVGLKRDARKANVQGVFEVVGDARGKNIIIFDDVWTTGSTIKNAANVLKRKGASTVWGLTLARSG